MCFITCPGPARNHTETLMSSTTSFHRLGLAEPCTQTDVLGAWRRLARKNHPDKTRTDDSLTMQELNEAKDQCLKSVIERDYATDEQEFVLHICKVLSRKMTDECDHVHVDFCTHVGNIIKPTLRKFYWIRAVDAMEWMIWCAMGDVAFEQAKEDEIPILCRYYNDFLGEAEWTGQDHTMMTVLNKYDTVKAGGHGNFARAVGMYSVYVCVLDVRIAPQGAESVDLIDILHAYLNSKVIHGLRVTCPRDLKQKIGLKWQRLVWLGLGNG
jgi:hypothetical protein